MPAQPHSTLPRASLAQDNPVFEEDRAPAYSRQQENPLFEEGQGIALSGRGLGGPLFAFPVHAPESTQLHAD